MQCTKCGTDNPDKRQSCTRCHTPLYYTCPSCKQTQSHGGKCDQCGVDFTKYAALQVFQAKTQADKENERTRRRTTVIRQLVWLPITGGLSLLKYLFSGKNH